MQQRLFSTAQMRHGMTKGPHAQWGTHDDIIELMRGKGLVLVVFPKEQGGVVREIIEAEG